MAEEQLNSTNQTPQSDATIGNVVAGTQDEARRPISGGRRNERGENPHRRFRNIINIAWISLGVASVLLALITAVVLYSERKSTAVMHHLNLLALDLQNVLSELADAQAAQREYLLTGQPHYIENVELSRKALDLEFDRLTALVKNTPAERQEVERVRYLVRQELDEFQRSQAREFQRSHARGRAVSAEILTERARKLAEAIRQSITGIDKENEGALARLVRRRRERLATALAAVSSTLLLAAAYLLVGQVILVRSMSERQKTEEELRTSENRFRTLCEQAPVGIYETDAQGQCTYTNSRWSQMSGLSAAESLGHGWKRALHPSDREGIFEGWEARASQGTSWGYRLLNPQGDIRWIRALGGPIYSVRGEITGFVGTIEDVSERKQAEDAMHEAFQQLKLITDNMSAGVTRCSRDLHYLWVSRSYAAWLGRAPEEFSSRPIVDIIGQESYVTIRPYIERVLSGEKAEYETQINRLGVGRWIHAVCVPTRDPDQNVDGWIGVLSDVTVRHEAEDRLRESEERFRNMADTAPVMIWLSGTDKGRTFFNKTWLDFTGRSMQQELGNGWAEGVHPDDRDHFLAVYSSSFDSRKSFQMEYRLRRSDGTYRWLLVNGIPRFTPDHIFEGYIGSCVDITDRIRAEEERQKFVSLADRSLQFIGMCDLDFRPFYLNAAGQRLVGLDNLEAACRVRVQDYFFPEDQSFITNEFFPRVLREGHGDGEIRFRHFKTGEAIWVIYNVFNIYDARGAPAGWATVSVDITERRRAELALQESRQELRSLAARLIGAEEGERKRISRELHDDLSQKIALLAFDTINLVQEPSLSKDQIIEQLRKIQIQVVHMAEGVRQIAHQLHPSILEDLGLGSALRELCEDFSTRTGIEATCENDTLSERLPMDIAVCLYRVAQEALHNTAKHAGASQVRMMVSRSPEGVSLSIRDNGAGFNPDANGRWRHGIGIVSMKERVRLVEGEFSIHSQIGQGTEVKVFVPLLKLKKVA
ncbi:MAG TPA: PAS domain S-box protein [Bryobacteraceae bacterium]